MMINLSIATTITATANSQANRRPQHINEKSTTTTPPMTLAQRATIRASRRINQFAIIFLIQYSPVLLNLTIDTLFRDLWHWWIAVLVVALVNAGGTMNCFAYVQLYGCKHRNRTGRGGEAVALLACAQKSGCKRT